jgi:hypothetical protein
LLGVKVDRKLSISRAWDEAKPILSRDGGLLATVAAALIVLPTALIGAVVPESSASLGHSLLELAAGLVVIVGQLALIRLALQPPTSVGAAIGHGARRFPSMFGAMVLLVLAMLVLIVPLVLLSMVLGVDLPSPGDVPTGSALLLVLLAVLLILAVSIRFTMATPVATAEQAGPLAILRRSWALTSGHFFRLLGFVLLLGICLFALALAAGALGAIIGRLVSPDLEPMSVGALILGLFSGLAQAAFTILSSVMLARIYVQLAGGETEVSVPSAGA